jgi:uncharacterized protein YdaU (DUF1376 family)
MSSAPTRTSAVGDAIAPTSVTSRSTKAPAFQLYAADYLADPRVMAMTWEQRGVYTWLLFTCWNNNGELPADHATLARMLNISATKFEKNVWPALAPCFEISGDVYTHPHLTEQRAKHDAFRSRQAANGAKGGRPAKGLGYSGLSQREAKKSSSSSSSSSSINTVPSPSVALVVPTDGTAAAREERGESIAVSTHNGSPSGAENSKSSELAAWLAPIRAAFEEHGATWYARPAEELITLHERGIPAARVLRAARRMFDAPGLRSPSPKMLGAQWARWDGEAHAAERWALYSANRMTTAAHDDAWWDESIARVAKEGHAASAEAFRAELMAVRPWSISLDREGTLREVAKRLAAFIPPA